MIYPITAYGDPVLKEEAQDIPQDYPNLQELIQDMFDTMYYAHGVGLAAPQISKSIRLFVIDSEPMMDEGDEGKGVKKAFINPEIIEESGEEWGFEEGCLSIPGVRETVYRPERIVIRYFDEEWNEHEDTYDGMTARVIQHEYDHIEGILFTDHLNGLKKRLIKNKLAKISKGEVDADYKMKFPALAKKR
ncbi:peptide deformylase [Pontibacter aydingkolensis]|uniref:Peptide deformylase n=1 Tax=Pontibacter aydingkolensis TaxID=1911536 RepID=A0ABS7CQF2_9BACT|nr:peptide deformylase [Pontibacter aydingkolensis]MBW7466068.1 peptide deformylase [Pontibacter aydingkolensis]